MRRRAVLVAFLLVAAGCSELTLPTGSDGPAGATLTPAPVPTDAQATPDSELAPGLRADGVVDSGRLADAHARTLADRSYAVRITSTRWYGNGSLRSRFDRTIAFAREPGRFRYALTATLPGGRTHIERWGDGRRVYEFTNDTGGSVEVLGAPDEPSDPTRQFPDGASNRASIRRLFGLVDTTVTDRRRRNGTWQYRVAVEGGTANARPLRNVSLVAWVAASGLVSEYHVDYEVRHGRQLVRVAVDITYRRIGETTVERPAWVDRTETDERESRTRHAGRTGGDVTAGSG